MLTLASATVEHNGTCKRSSADAASLDERTTQRYVPSAAGNMCSSTQKVPQDQEGGRAAISTTAEEATAAAAETSGSKGDPAPSDPWDPTLSPGPAGGSLQTLDVSPAALGHDEKTRSPPPSLDAASDAAVKGIPGTSLSQGPRALMRRRRRNRPARLRTRPAKWTTRRSA